MKCLLTLALTLILAGPVLAQDVTIEMENDVYDVGSQIPFTITNNTDRPLQFASAPAYCVYNIDDGCLAASLPVMVVFPEHMVLHEVYNDALMPLTPGPCRILVRWYDLDMSGPFTTQIDFLLMAEVPTPTLSFEALKSRYR